MRLFGELLPFMGWREYDRGVIEALAEELDDIDPARRYSGFHIGWLGYYFAFGFTDRGPREYERNL